MNKALYVFKKSILFIMVILLIIGGAFSSAVAENITTEGLELYTLPVGTKLRIGQALTDRRGEAFPLLPVRMDEGCLVQLLSCRARSLGKIDLPVHILLDFTLESREEALSILRAYRCGNADSAYLERFDQGVE